MRILFAGTPAFAVPALEALVARHEWRPLAVLTQPDRAAGRGRKLRFGPVKQLALDAGLDVLQPPSLKSAEAQSALARYRPELLVTAAYGLLLPRQVLEMPVLGCWNLHASLLPRWRGASPINQAVLAGDAETGVSLMEMETGLDTGPVLLERAVSIADGETAGNLHDRLAKLAAEVLVEALDALEAGRLPPARAQDDARATHAPLIAKSDAEIDWRASAARIDRMVRAYQPWPVAWGSLGGASGVRIHRARPAAGRGEPGEILRDAGGRLLVACGEGALEILELQMPGRKRVRARDWLNAHAS
ncbi:MAG: methionyl-tRNA formyltransferase [Gammaproteobacteria bacterium]|jgi:methionyl-tRNA formyltransferase|nr:methionyl-tRNA formyltransferase [Gammaproteobacteria bacterium]